MSTETEPTKLDLRKTFALRMRNAMHDFCQEEGKSREVSLIEIVGSLEAIKHELLLPYASSIIRKSEGKN